MLDIFYRNIAAMIEFHQAIGVIEFPPMDGHSFDVVAGICRIIYQPEFAGEMDDRIAENECSIAVQINCLVQPISPFGKENSGGPKLRPSMGIHSVCERRGDVAVLCRRERDPVMNSCRIR